MRKLLLSLPLHNRLGRDIARGIVSYCRANTDWYVTAISPARPPQLRDPADVIMITYASNPPAFALARRLKLPHVVIGQREAERRSPRVCIDEAAVGKMAAEHLAGLGLKHFAFVGHHPWRFCERRAQTFARALAEMGHAPPRVFRGWFYSGGRRVGQGGVYRWLTELPRPCGVLAADDYIGAETIQLAQLGGLRVPDDLAVLGVDDDDLAVLGLHHVSPRLLGADSRAGQTLRHVPLSSVVQPLFALGYQAARLLDEICRGAAGGGQGGSVAADATGRTILLPPVRVAARASSDLIAIDDPDVAAAMRLIRDHAHQPIDVGWVAAQLPVSRRSLERKFHSLTGQTILQRIHQVRFSKVKELLADTDLPLKIIARRTGVANAKWLSDGFRRFAGATPSSYRRQFRLADQPPI